RRRGHRLPHRCDQHRSCPHAPGPRSSPVAAVRRRWRGDSVRPHLGHDQREAAVMSTPSGRQAGAFGDELTNAALMALVGMFGIALILRASGSVAAFLTGTPQPETGPAAGLGLLFNPGDPAAALDADGLNPTIYWIITAAMLAGLVTAGAWVWARLRRHSRRVETDPRRLAGTATAHEVNQSASAKALLRRAETLRVSLTDPSPSDVGYRIGASKGGDVWASVEESILLSGQPRSGTGVHNVIPAILERHRAVVNTTTRPVDHNTCL